MRGARVQALQLLLRADDMLLWNRFRHVLLLWVQQRRLAKCPMWWPAPLTSVPFRVWLCKHMRHWGKDDRLLRVGVRRSAGAENGRERVQADQ